LKLLAKPIDVLVVCFRHGKPMPYRFRFTNEYGDEQVIRINKVINISERRIPGSVSYIYECQSDKGSNSFRYELMYTPASSRWLLYKI